jgi:hypothetical protein
MAIWPHDRRAILEFDAWVDEVGSVLTSGDECPAAIQPEPALDCLQRSRREESAGHHGTLREKLASRRVREYRGHPDGCCRYLEVPASGTIDSGDLFKGFEAAYHIEFETSLAARHEHVEEAGLEHGVVNLRMEAAVSLRLRGVLTDEWFELGYRFEYGPGYDLRHLAPPAKWP